MRIPSRRMPKAVARKVGILGYTWIIRAVYEEVQSCMSPGFPLRATDRLLDDLHIDPEDIEMEVLMCIAEQTGRSLKELNRNPYYSRLSTIGDLVNFFNNQPYSDPRQPRTTQ